MFDEKSVDISLGPLHKKEDSFRTFDRKEANRILGPRRGRMATSAVFILTPDQAVALQELRSFSGRTTREIMSAAFNLLLEKVEKK